MSQLGSEQKIYSKLLKNELKLNKKLTTWMNIEMNELHGIAWHP
jgi:hypothetical protein